MKVKQSSITAEHNALLRAHEAMRPETERICYDPYARFFIPDPVYSAVDRDDQIRRAVADWKTHFPGVGNAILARTRFIDDCLQEAILAGVQQLVILGAGYDTRAFRFEALKEDVAVFELDHPDTQQRKLDKIKRHMEAHTTAARYLPIDFSKDDLSQTLFDGGYNSRLTTLFIWEGVTYYIPAPAVDRTLDVVNRHAVSRSSILFDYFPAAIADGTTRIPEARALREGLKRIGEAILFGIQPERIDAFMKKRGFAVVKHLALKDYKDAYFTGTNQSRTVSEMFLFVQATVP